MIAIDHQAINWFFWRIIFRLACLTTSLVSIAAATNSEQIIILVDQSKSVDETNRNEALELAAALIEGRQWDKTSWTADSNAEKHMNLATSGLAADRFTCVAAPVGNYTNVANLRQQLLSPQSFQRSQSTMLAWLKEKQFFSTDNSTHLTLTQAVVASTTILKNSTKPYYLLVISDFKEDCLNRPLSDYEPETYRKLIQQNELVFQGNLSYNDGPAGKGNYSTTDTALIKEYRDKLASEEESLIGTFHYSKQVPDGKRPVELRLFAPNFRRTFMVPTDKQRIMWNVVDPLPEIPLQHNGFKGDELIRVELNGNFVKDASISDWKSSVAWSFLLDKMHEQEWKIGSPTTITLTVAENQLTRKMLTTGFTLQPFLPVLTIETPDVEKSTEAKPYLLSSKEPLTNATIDFALEPTPKQWQAIVKVPGSDKKGKSCKDSIKVSDYFSDAAAEGEDSEDPSKKIQLQIDVAHNFPFGQHKISKIIYLKLPQNQVWVEVDGVKIEALEEALELPKSRAVTFKATYAGMKNFKWLKPTILREADSMNVSDSFTDKNNLDFANLDPGEYKITAKFEFTGQAGSETFRIIVPKKTPWMLIIVGIMAIVSIVLFTFHFLRR